MSSRGHPSMPVGSKMTDSGYPFRGEYRLDDSINHGHSGVTRKPPTSLALKITGSNLVIERLQTNKGTDMSCEIAVDGGVPRPVTFDSADVVALAVPGDGHEYNLTAVLKTEYAKHFCRMSFNGSEGRSYVRIRIPDDVDPEIIHLFADGRRLRPSAGWYSIPLNTKDCSLALAMPTAPAVAGGRVAPVWVEEQSALSPLVHGAARSAPSLDDARATAPTSIVIETLPGTADHAVLRCTGSGQNISLKKSATVAIPTNAGPYTLELPLECVVPAAAPSAVTPAATAGIPAPVPVPVAGGGLPAPVPVSAVAPGAATAPTEPPELETRVTAGSGGGTPSFTATCKNYFVQLIGDNGTTMSGFGTAALPLVNRNAQRVRIVITDNQGKVWLRQSSYIPTMQTQPVNVRFNEDANGMTVAGNERTSIVIGGVRSMGNQGVRINRSSLQRIIVEQNQLDGTVSTASIDVGPKPYVAPTSTAGSPSASTYNPYGASSTATAASPTTKPDEQWLATLAQAVQASSLEEARRLMNQVRAPNAQAAALVSFASDALFKSPPIISFTTNETHVQAINCAGYNLTATIQNQQPCLMPANSQVQVPPNSSAIITAVNPKNGRQMASVRVQLTSTPAAQTAGSNRGASVNPSSPLPTSVAPTMSLTPQSNITASPLDGPDSQLVARLLDTLQRRNMDPAAVAQELQAATYVGLTPTAQRMLPLLINTLRNVANGGQPNKAPELFFTCGNGYLTNIYTEHPQYQISAVVDNQTPVMVSQRGRLPSDGSCLSGSMPHFVRLTARDPITGAVKADTTITILGADGVSQTAAPPYPASSGISPFTTPSAGLPSTVVPALPSGFGVPAGVPPPAPASLSAVPDSLARQAQTEAGTAAEAPPSGPIRSDSRGQLPSLDVMVQRVEGEQHIRLVCAPHLRIVCRVDGNGGDTGRSDFVTKLPANRAHSFQLTLLDYYGNTAFQQKLDLPASNDAPVWGLALQDNGLAVDPDGNSLVTYALDRFPERAAQGGFVGFTTDTSHVVQLRKYISGMHGHRVGEVTLRVPGFVSLAELEALTEIYRARLGHRLDDNGAKSQLHNLANRVSSPQVRTLIGLLLDTWASSGRDGASSGRLSLPAVPSSNRAITAPGDQGQVYFRLSGI